ncbi:hypothetical protein [Streptomyces sp. NPDC056723]|uniref:hypothetical protein n=1 Tax=Streptomyces sp. NPDC056723 TaxID=3345925 RepID=UPI0036A03D36
MEEQRHGRDHRGGDEDVDKEHRYLEVAAGEQMAGVIIAAASRHRTDLSALVDRGTPVVAVDRRRAERRSTP